MRFVGIRHSWVLIAGCLAAGCASYDRYPYYGGSDLTYAEAAAVAVEAPPPSPAYPALNDFDRSLVSQVRESIRGNPDLTGIEPSLVISSENGMVTLRGIVASERERNLVGERARGTTSVVNVINYLQITPIPAVQVPNQNATPPQQD